MNYYEHHIGDYDEATAHLTACEDGIYSRLIRKYMASEKPLPADVKTLQRLVRARARDEKEAVQTILDEFFELHEDGWHQKRCDETIARYQDKQAKARRSAEARWGAQRSQSDGNANASADVMRTHSEGNANQAPVTNNQTPNPEPMGETASVGAPLTRAKPAELSAAMKRHSVASQPGDPRVIAAAEAGVSVETVDAACAEAKAAKPGERINAGYVLTIAERWTREARSPRATGRPAAVSADDRRRAISEANALAFLNGQTSDPNVIDMEH